MRLSEKQLALLLESNPDLRVSADVAPHRRFSVPPLSSPLADRFEALLVLLNAPPFVKEYRFHPGRRWRFDYAWPNRRVAVELHGATWAQGRHVRGNGFREDREKINAAQAAGWRVFELTKEMITLENCEMILSALEGKPWS